jgi:hypothetical protein
MRPASWCQCRLPLLALLAFPGAAESLSAEEIPYFARRYRVACSQCHVAPPKLNGFGEAFVAAGYQMPSLVPNRTWPFAVWVSGRSDSRPPGSTEEDVPTGSYRDRHWTGLLGVAKSGDVTRGRWSLEGEVFPARLRGFLGVGARVEDQGGDGVEHAIIPYLNAHFPATRYTIRLTLERRLQRDRNATFLENGTVF